LYLPKEEVRGDWRKFHDEKLCNLHSLPNFIRVVKSRRMGVMVQVACIVKKCMQHLGGGNLKERNGIVDIGIDVSIILKWILQKVNAGQSSLG
jgi:hypothetical protein